MFVSIVASLYNIYWVDGIVGIGISAWICFTGIKIFIESYNVLMDISLDKETKEKIIKMCMKEDGVLLVEDIHSVSIGYKYIVVLTIGVSGNLDTFTSHKIATLIEKKITKSFDNVKEVFVHINPI